MKNIIIEIGKKFLCIFFVFPIKNNRIFFSAYSGRQYSCNPKYISDWIEQNYKDEFEIIWAFNEPDAFSYLKNRNIKCVKFKSIKYLYYLLTSKIVIDNVESWSILQSEKIESSRVKNVSDYPDMQELLLISDVLITDYSSSIWDFSLMEKPCFLFMPDYNEYIDEREFYTPIQDWPYPASFSMEDLEDKIIKYDHEIAKKRILNHHIKLGICESGMASEIVGKEIVKLCRYQ